MEERKAVLDAGQLVTPLVAAICCLLAATRVEGRAARWSWGLLSVAYAASFAGEALWAFYEVVLGIETPTPSFADLAYGIFYPLAFLALILQVRRDQQGMGWATTLLDALMFTVCAFGLSWAWLLRPALANADDLLFALIQISWPVGDLLIMLALVSMILAWPLDRVPVPSLYLLGAFLALIYADTVFTRGMLDGTYQTGNAIDPLWAVSYALGALSAVIAVKASKAAGKEDGWRKTLNLSWTSSLRLLLPYLCLPAAMGLLYMAVEHPEEFGGDVTPVLVASTVVIALVLLRQLLTLVANRRLSLALVQLSSELEDRVATRTSELSQRTGELNALNLIATALSRCQTSEEVLNSDLRMACEATGAQAGAVWLLRPDGHTNLVARCALPGSTDDLVANLPQDVPSVVDGISGRNATFCSKGDELSQPSALDTTYHLPANLAAAPLVSRGTVMGALGVMGGADRDGASFNVSLFEAIGAEMGVALESAQRYEHATYLADRDPVTNLYNHRAFHRRLNEELKRHQRDGRSFSMVMMDIDGFKLFNDTHGHPIGDQVLREVAGVLIETARDSDVIARYGGDEFAAILPGTATDGGVIFANRVRSCMAEKPFMRSDGGRVPLHLSFGVATFPEDGRTSHELVGCADTNLYASKDKGGDSITAAADSPSREITKMGSFGILDGLITAVDHKDKYTRKHSEQVTRLSLLLASVMGLSEETQRILRIAGLLHDVGKIGVPDRVLRKPGRLDEDEYNAVKQHAQLGEMLVKDVPHITNVLAAIGAHHERYDGQGYPRGLKGSEIPFLGRILAVADAYSAMTTDRPYRKALSVAEARAELRHVAGTQLDPEVVDIFIKMAVEDEDESAEGLLTAS